MRHARRKTGGESGFTLIEVLVALVVLGTAAGLLLAAQTASGRLARAVMERESAVWLARSRLVEAAAFPDRLPPEDNREDRHEGVNYQTRIGYREISPLTEVPIDKVPLDQRLIEIRVDVTWGAPRPASVTMVTYTRIPRGSAGLAQ